MENTVPRAGPRGPHGFVPIGSLQLIALSGIIAVGVGSGLTAANQRSALVNGVELVELAHAEARTTALRTGRRVTLEIDPRTSRLRVVFATLDPPEATPLVREVRPEAVSIRTRATVLCFDGLGRPLTALRCTPHAGTIEVRTLAGTAVLTLTRDGRLLR